MGALSKFLRERTRGNLRFSKEIEDFIDPEKLKDAGDKATGERMRRGYESQREGAGAVREELERQKKPRHGGGMNGIRG